MRDVVLQDWVTIRGQDRTLNLTQASADWLDIDDAEDFTVFLDVREVSSSAPSLTYQTAPTKNDAAFKAMLPTFLLTPGVRVDRIITAYAAVPPARWFRWALTHGGVPWDVTFRIRLAAYAWVKT
jgi:hypothetical protein